MDRRALMLQLSRMTLAKRKDGEQTRRFKWFQRLAEDSLLACERWECLIYIFAFALLHVLRLLACRS